MAPLVVCAATQGSEQTDKHQVVPWADWHAQMIERMFSNPGGEVKVSAERYKHALSTGDLPAMRRAMVEVDTIGAETPVTVDAFTRAELLAQIAQARVEGDQASLFDLLTTAARGEEFVYELKKADDMLDEAERIARALGDPERLVQVHFERGWRHYYMDRKADATMEFNSAFAMTTRSIERAQILLAQMGLLQGTTRTVSSLSAIAGQIESTVDIDRFPVIGLVIATEMGEALQGVGNLAEAEKYYRAALARGRATGVRTAGATQGLAGLLIDRGELTEAETLLRSRDWTGESEFLRFYATIIQIRLLSARGDPRAVDLLPRAESLLRAFSGGLAASRRFHEAQVDAYSAAKRYKEALEAAVALRRDTQALHVAHNEALRLDLSTRYQVSAKESELALAKSTAALLEQRRDALGVGLLAAMVFLLVVATLLWIQIQQKKRMIVLKGQVEDANRHLQALHNARTTLLAAACHDLRQPAHALGLLAELAEGVDDPGGQQAKLAAIKHCSSTLTEMLSSLMDLTQLEGGNYKPMIEPVSLEQLLGEVGLQYSGAADQKGLELRIEPTDLVALSDRHLLRRIVFNLVSNAVRYTKSGYVSVSVTDQQAALQVVVTDTGPGIPEDRLEAVFSDHVRLDVEHIPEGLGLGLPIVRRAAALLGHTVALESTLGQGTCVRIGAPQVTDQPAEHKALIPPQFGLGRRVCLVEDDLDAREALSAILRRWGFKVDEAPDFVSLRRELEATQGQRPDLLISDMHIGRESGLASLIQLRHDLGEPKVPAMLLTGDLDHEIQSRASLEGIEVGHKPLLPRRLQSRLAEMLAQ